MAKYSIEVIKMPVLYRILRIDDKSNHVVDESEDYDTVVEVFRVLRRVYPERWYQIDESVRT